MKGTTHVEKLKFFTNNQGIIDLGQISSATVISCNYNKE